MTLYDAAIPYDAPIPYDGAEDTPGASAGTPGAVWMVRPPARELVPEEDDAIIMWFVSEEM